MRSKLGFEERASCFKVASKIERTGTTGWEPEYFLEYDVRMELLDDEGEHCSDRWTRLELRQQLVSLDLDPCHVVGNPLEQTPLDFLAWTAASFEGIRTTAAAAAEKIESGAADTHD